MLVPCILVIIQVFSALQALKALHRELVKQRHDVLSTNATSRSHEEALQQQANMLQHFIDQTAEKQPAPLQDALRAARADLWQHA